MRKKILLPTDFSSNSWHAINYAIALYKNEACDFYVLNVFSATNDILTSLLNMDTGSELYEMAKAKSEDGLAELMDKLTLKYDFNPKHHFETISSFNNVVEAIKYQVEERDIDLIIMGTKGETADKAVNYGSTAMYVMEKVRNCPVLVVPEFCSLELPEEIVFPTSYKTHYKKRELANLVEIAQKSKASIAILHIKEANALDGTQEAHKNLLEEILEDVSHSFHTLPEQDIESGINRFVAGRDSNMVAFINKKHLFFGSVFTNPLVKKIGFRSEVPILVLHDLRN